MSRRLIVHALAGLGVTLAIGACAAPQVGNPCPIPDNATDKERLAAINTCNAPIGTLPLPFSLKKDVDILFLIDNSPSMAPKQEALAAAIPQFIQLIDATGANYHVGIATSDIGADVAQGQTWGGTAGTCDTFAGDDGVLQAKPCTERTFMNMSGKMACDTLCPDPKYVPTDKTNFISKVNGLTNVPVNMKLDPKTGKMVDQGPINAFQCMALIGDQGCGVEGQLEGSKRALDGHRNENAGFLRSNSILAVIYITDEDDCSVQLGLRNQLNPATRDCDPTQPDAYDCYNIDYRCLARSVQCNESMLTTGVKTGCKERPNNFLEPLNKYSKFFSALRPASQLLISGIWTLPSVPNGGRIEVAQSGATPVTTGTLNRATGASASCNFSSTVYGQAQYRLSQFTSLLPPDTTNTPPTPSSLEVSICDINNYPTALANIAAAINKKGMGSCLPVIPKTSNGKPVCVVGDVDTASPNGSPDVQFPVCSTACCNAFANSLVPTPADMAIQAACAADTTDACYCAIKSNVGQCKDTVVAGIWRKDGNSAPVGKQANFLCAGGG